MSHIHPSISKEQLLAAQTQQLSLLPPQCHGTNQIRKLAPSDPNKRRKGKERFLSQLRAYQLSFCILCSLVSDASTAQRAAEGLCCLS